MGNKSGKGKLATLLNSNKYSCEVPKFRSWKPIVGRGESNRPQIFRNPFPLTHEQDFAVTWSKSRHEKFVIVVSEDPSNQCYPDEKYHLLFFRADRKNRFFEHRLIFPKIVSISLLELISTPQEWALIVQLEDEIVLISLPYSQSIRDCREIGRFSLKKDLKVSSSDDFKTMRLTPLRNGMFVIRNAEPYHLHSEKHHLTIFKFEKIPKEKIEQGNTAQKTVKKLIQLRQIRIPEYAIWTTHMFFKPDDLLILCLLRGQARSTMIEFHVYDVSEVLTSSSTDEKKKNRGVPTSSIFELNLHTEREFDLILNLPIRLPINFVEVMRGKGCCVKRERHVRGGGLFILLGLSDYVIIGELSNPGIKKEVKIKRKIFLPGACRVRELGDRYILIFREFYPLGGEDGSLDGSGPVRSYDGKERFLYLYEKHGEKSSEIERSNSNFMVLSSCFVRDWKNVEMGDELLTLEKSNFRVGKSGDYAEFHVERRKMEMKKIDAKKIEKTRVSDEENRCEMVRGGGSFEIKFAIRGLSAGENERTVIKTYPSFLHK